MTMTTRRMMAIQREWNDQFSVNFFMSFDRKNNFRGSQMSRGCISLSEDGEWETPPLILKKAMRDFDIYPSLDVCATPENRKCKNFYRPEEDGLQQDWKQDFFMNPPYSRTGEWVEKAYLEHKKWNVTGLTLLFSKTDTYWWHEYIENKAEIHFIRGRVRFLKNVELGKYHAPYPSVWVIWRRT